MSRELTWAMESLGSVWMLDSGGACNTNMACSNVNMQIQSRGGCRRPGTGTLLPSQEEHAQYAGRGQCNEDGTRVGDILATARRKHCRLPWGTGTRSDTSLQPFQDVIRPSLQVDRIELNLRKSHPEVKHVDLEVL